MMRSLKGRCATGLGTRLLLLLGECLLLLSGPDTRPCFLWTFTHLPKIKIKGHTAKFKIRQVQVFLVSNSKAKSYHGSDLKLFLNSQTVATPHKTRDEQQDYDWSDNRTANMLFLIQSSGQLYKSHPDFEREACTRDNLVHFISIISLCCHAICFTYTQQIQYVQHFQLTLKKQFTYINTVLVHLSVSVWRGSVAASGIQWNELTVGLAYCWVNRGAWKLKQLTQRGPFFLLQY